MLIRLIINPADENRSRANQVLQHLSFLEHFRGGNAASYPDYRWNGCQSPFLELDETIEAAR